MASAIERAIAVLAAQQYGYITRAQLLGIRLGTRAIDYRIARGRLIRVYAGVYAVGHVDATPVARARAAVLACGERAVLSYGSAATLWGFNKYWDMPFEVTAPTVRAHKGIRVHRSRTLTADDVTDQLGVPVTTPERTALDIAPRLRDRRLTRVINDGRHAGFVHLNDLADVLERNPTHPGTKRLRRFVDNPKNPSRSPLEDEFEELARRHHLPAPLTNTYLLGYEVDILYPAERVIVEVDGYEFHSDRDSFERDRERDAAMLAADILTVRLTRPRMNQNPEREAARLNAILDRRRRAA